MSFERKSRANNNNKDLKMYNFVELPGVKIYGWGEFAVVFSVMIIAVSVGHRIVGSKRIEAKAGPLSVSVS